jgi:hypothetical protein
MRDDKNVEFKGVKGWLGMTVEILAGRIAAKR